MKEVDGCGTGHLPPPRQNKTEEDRVTEGEPQEEDYQMNRLFDAQLYPKSFKPEEMTVSWGKWNLLACPDSQVKCASCGNRPFHVGCLVISISAKCINGDEPRCAIGVYYGVDNELNVASEIHEEPNTEQVALLRACVIALVHVINTCQVNKPKKGNDSTFPLHTVVIKSDSPYVVQGVTEWMPKWKANGWKNSRGKPVANESMWRLVDVWIRQLEPKVAVQFWHVPKERNVEADCLCVYGLHGPKLADGSSPGFLKLTA